MATLLNETSYRTTPLPFITPNRGEIATPASLVEAVQTAVQKIDKSSLRSIATEAAGLAFQPRVLLAVLTYYFARKVYGASEILEHLVRDEPFCKVCRREFPNVRDIELFREQNSGILESCLKAVLQYQAEAKVTSGFVTRANETIIMEEARRRIITAAYLNRQELAYERQPVIA